jgi:RimJ/RimL family protein N-acetyltransferase
VGELRLVVDRGFRGTGLSQLLVQELLAIALEESLLKVIVQMTVDQHAAIGLFSRLGFQREAVLKNHVQDQHGQLRDLVMMTYFFQP